jgi:phosphotransferase system enzyme I (PtsP)
MLEDTRFRDAAVERVVRGASIHATFDQLARESIRVSDRMLADDADARQRAADVEDLFGAVAMLAQDDPRARPPRASVLVGSSLTPYDVLVTTRSNPVGVVLTERTGGSRACALLRLLNVPALLDVGGVSRWVSDGDIALLDATRGYLLLNPTRTEVAALRASRRES